jgi:hypothetical protein
MPEEIMSDKIILKYIGNASLIEIPARDLTEDDLKNIAWTGWTEEKLVESGLYELVQRAQGGLVSPDSAYIFENDAAETFIPAEPKEEKQSRKRGK